LVGYVSVFRVALLLLALSIVVIHWHLLHLRHFTQTVIVQTKRHVYTALLRHGVGNACTSPGSLADNNIFILVVAKR